MLINLLGGDGCGKTSQAARLCAWLRADLHLAARALGKRDLFDPLAYPAADFFGVSYEHVAHQCLPRMQGAARALFLYYMNAMLVQAAPPRPGEVVVLDGYWQKHYATEAAMGTDAGWLLGLGDALPAPDLTLVLDLDPRVIVQRGHCHQPYESGCNFGCSDAAFIAHQDRVRSHILLLARNRGYPVIDADRPELAVFQHIEQYVRPALRVSNPA